MKTTSSKAFIQARMNSTRYPGKSLAPLKGEPLLDRVISRVSSVIPPEDIVVLTTVETPEDPIAAHLNDRGIKFIRGNPKDVFRRFLDALSNFPCECFFRVCGDSPFLEPTLFERAMELYERRNYDIVTNVLERDFPPGKSVELVDTDAFLEVDRNDLSSSQQEHVTKCFYDNYTEFFIYDIKCPVNTPPDETYAVDTLEDLKRLEARVENNTLNETRYEVT